MQVVVVTGASSGIGRATAVRLARSGTGVVLTYRGNPAGAQEAVAAIEQDGGTAVALPLDLGRSDTFPAFRDTLRATLRSVWARDTIDGLVNNAGASGIAPFEDTTEELFDELTRVLLKGPYFLTQALLPLLADGGAVVNIASNSTGAGLEPGYSVYGTLKGGLVVLTRYLAKELSPRGIRVNAVSPGATRTRIADDAFTRHPEVIPAIAARTALGRVGEPDDVAAAVAALLGDAGRWITAQNIDVSGGYNL